ncbi:MAG: bis(5'-nucleosyl)-tetraphosphatase (symmetrical) YqeK [Firmicutes bacterium]|nr:bis(5'-nucleosyl)-tetraphosphatase (symmetrical) YqeK [Bacillota bacterium]
MIELKPLKEKRMNHCISVAKLCYDLALAHGADPMKAYLCGIFHDIAREIPKDQMVEIAKDRGIEVGAEEQAEPLLLHGALAAVVMKENYGIEDSEMLDAVACHTVGRADMTVMDKILFLADKTEPLRSYEGVDELRAKAFTDLNGALLEAVKGEMDYCGMQGYPVHPNTILLKTSLEQEGE